jgi:hypothetical protein
MCFLLAGNVVKAADESLQEMVQETVQGLKEISGSSKKYILSDESLFQAGNSVCDWAALGMAVSGEQEAYGDYLERLEEYVEESYRQKDCLDSVKATPYHTSVLTVLALGGNPLEFGKDVKGNSINLLADGTYNFKGDSLGAQGISGYIYALIALDAKAYEIPEGADYSREDILEAILEKQSENGGFSISGTGDDIDITAMALQALAPYKEQEQVKAGIDKALNWLATQMTPYGTFCCGSMETCESTAQVILAACALDLEIDDKFQKDGITPWDGLQEFRLADGTYVHTLAEKEGNLIATEQALLALEAVQLRETQNKWILDFTEYEMSEEQYATKDVPEMESIIGVVIVVATVMAVIAKKKKEKGKKEYV